MNGRRDEAWQEPQAGKTRDGHSEQDMILSTLRMPCAVCDKCIRYVSFCNTWLTAADMLVTGLGSRDMNIVDSFR